MPFSPSRRKAKAPRRARPKLALERLEGRFALDGAAPDWLPAGEEYRFFLSERGIGEGPAVENPTVQMRLGETKTLFVWMKLPTTNPLLAVAMTVVADRGGVVEPIGQSFYEPEPGVRWVRASHENLAPPARAGDVLAGFLSFTLDTSGLGYNFRRQHDPSYDAATGAVLYGSLTVTAGAVGETDLFFEVDPFKIVPSSPPGPNRIPFAPVHFGAGDDPVRGNDVHASSALADGRIVVWGPADGAQAADDRYEFHASPRMVFEVAASEGVLANDGPAGGAELELLSPPRFGTLALNPDGSFRYTAPGVQYVADRARHDTFGESFTYRLVGPDGTSRVGRVSLELSLGIEAVGDRLSFDLHQQSSINIAQSHLMQNDRAFSLRSLEFAIESPPTHGELVMDEQTERVLYVPEPGFRGEDSFVYRVSNEAGSSTATVHIEVNLVNQRPVGAADAVEVWMDGETTFRADWDMLTNDFDADGDRLRIEIASQPIHGQLFLLDCPGKCNSLAYQANDGTSFTSDSFTYVVNDGFETSEPITVTLQSRQRPVALPDEITVLGNPEYVEGELWEWRGEEEERIIFIRDLLVNDSDPRGADLSAGLWGEAHLGSVAETQWRDRFVYVPPRGFSGDDRFSYVVSNWIGTSLPATVIVHVLPFASGGGETTGVGVQTIDDHLWFSSHPVPTFSIEQSELTRNDRWFSSANLEFTVESLPLHGELRMSSLAFTERLTYDPAPGFSGEDSFTYRLSNEFGSSTATVNIQVDWQNHRPVAALDEIPVRLDGETAIDVGRALLQNDFDADGDSLEFSITTEPLHGRLLYLDCESRCSTLSYLPDDVPGFAGDSFTYYVDDGFESSEPVTVTLVRPATGGGEVNLGGITVGATGGDVPTANHNGDDQQIHVFPHVGDGGGVLLGGSDGTRPPVAITYDDWLIPRPETRTEVTATRGRRAPRPSAVDAALELASAGEIVPLRARRLRGSR